MKATSLFCDHREPHSCVCCESGERVRHQCKLNATAYKTMAGWYSWYPRGRLWDKALMSVKRSWLWLIQAERAFMYSMVSGPQSSWGLEGQQGGDAAWRKAQSHAADGSGDGPAWTPAMLHAALEADPPLWLLNVAPSHSFLSPAAGEPSLWPSPSYKKAGKMVFGTSSL